MSFSEPRPSAGPSPTPLSNPTTVVSSKFLASYPVDLYISEKLITIKEGAFTVTNVDGEVIVTVEGSLFSHHDTRQLLDSAGSPILTFRQKIISIHRRWEVYRVDSSSSKDLLFIAKKSGLVQFKTELDVFLATNTKEDQHDFKVKGSFRDKASTIYSKDNTIIGQMHKDVSIKNSIFGKDVFSVTVYPQVDVAFIVAVVVILHEINQDRSGKD